MTDHKTPMEPQEARRVLEFIPAFAKDISLRDTMYSPRTGLYVVRGINFAFIQLEKDCEEYFCTTMHHGCSFYDEYIYLSDLEKIAGTP